MAWQPLQRPLIAAAYALNLGVRARRAVIRRRRRHVAWIERDGTFWEVIDDETGEAYRANFLAPSDDGMLWSAIFLDLLENPSLPAPIMRVSPPPSAQAVADAAGAGGPNS